MQSYVKKNTDFGSWQITYLFALAIGCRLPTYPKLAILSGGPSHGRCKRHSISGQKTSMACARWSVSPWMQWSPGKLLVTVSGSKRENMRNAFLITNHKHKSHKFISMYVYCRYSFGFPCNKQVKTIKDNNKYIPLGSASWYEPWSWQTCRELLLNSVWENDVDFNDYIIYLHTLCWRSACWRWVLDPCIILMSSHKILSCLVFC